jgi:hypothetical protein
MKYRLRVADIGITERLQGTAADVCLCHSDHDADHRWTRRDTLRVLGGTGKMLIVVYRVLVHC